jgi:hypothetical protein
MAHDTGQPIDIGIEGRRDGVFRVIPHLAAPLIPSAKRLPQPEELPSWAN